jgi:2-phosphosulfolactate phosphatase
MSSAIPSTSDDVFSQSGHRVRLEWGRAGTRRAAERGDVIVVVDVVRFTSTVATALHRGVSVYPCAMEENAEEYARKVGAELGSGTGRFSLSPLSFIGAEVGTRVVLRSPNGATCARYGARVPHLFAGALVNAKAVGRVVAELLGQLGCASPSWRAESGGRSRARTGRFDLRSRITWGRGR